MSMSHKIEKDKAKMKSFSNMACKTKEKQCNKAVSTPTHFPFDSSVPKGC